jgi:hypothetical protein
MSVSLINYIWNVTNIIDNIILILIYIKKYTCHVLIKHFVTKIC